MDQEVSPSESLLLQTYLLNIMLECGYYQKYSGQSWKEHLSPFSTHLVPKKRPRPVTTAVPDNLAAHTQLPLEIMTMVYDLADLESCVSLRETSSAWYSLFQKTDF